MSPAKNLPAPGRATGLADVLRARHNPTFVEPAIPEPAPADPFVPKPLDPATVTGTPEERLAAFEQAIDAAKATASTSLKAARARFVVEAGTALRAIRDEDGGLYKGSYATFEEYILKRWDMDRSRAYQLIDAAPAMLVMSKIFDTAPVESQARAMIDVIEAHGEAAVREVVAAVKQSGEKVTVASLKATAARMGYLPKQPDHGPGDSRTEPATEHTPEQARALARLEQGLAALRGAHRALRGRIIADALEADPEQGRVLAAQVRDLAGKIDRLTR
ncbi:hypothetical protein ACW7N6_38380 [Streptomyces sp. UC1A3]